MPPSTITAKAPRYFEEYLARRWAKGCVRGRRLFQEVKARGDTGSFSNFERLLTKWSNPKRKMPRPALPPLRTPAVDRATGRLISPIVAAALCVKPRGFLTSAQVATVDALKSEWPEFAPMRRLAMRFRSILRSKNTGKLAAWLKDAQQSETLRDAAVRPHITQGHRRREKRDHRALEQWPNGRADQSSEISQTSQV